MSTASDLTAIESKLDLLISLFRIAHDEPLKAERAAILAEPVSKAILVGSGDWIEAGKLKAAVQKKQRCLCRPLSVVSPGLWSGD